MNEEFNLIYYHRETGEMYLVKRITVHDYIIMDMATNTKMPVSKHFLDKSYKADKKNTKRQGGHRKNPLNFRKRKSA